ncbi:MAG: hypothetical protein ACRDPH_12140 [Marmoricola sp.]
MHGLQQRWLETQAYLLDDPRDSVTKADALIDDAMKHLNAALNSKRKAIHAAWSNDDSLSTDDLRTTLQDYRALFQHLIGTSYVPDRNKSSNA